MTLKHTNPTKPRWDKKARMEVTAVTQEETNGS